MSERWSLVVVGVLLIAMMLTAHMGTSTAFVGSIPVVHTRQQHLVSTSCLLLVQKQGSSSNNNKYAPLPRGISPFQRSSKTSQDMVMDEFLRFTVQALTRAIANGQVLLEVDFPANLLQCKSQFEDYDNLSELDMNRDFVVRLAAAWRGTGGGRATTIWIVFPDDQECALAQQAWQGQSRFQQSALFTSIRAALAQVAGEDQVVRPWGTLLASTMNKWTGGDGILASDSSLLDDLSAAASSSAANRLHLVCQPGNGGPVEDWINVERLHQASSAGSKVFTCIINGAADKVRDGYYPPIFFPALAQTVPFYQNFCPVWVLKPLSDKGVYGWLYRSHPEPWQVILQTVQRQEQLQSSQKQQYSVQIQEHVAMVSEQRPTYQQAIQALIRTAAQLS